MQKKILVIIPAYNEEESIRETIESIEKALNQIKIDYEIVVINDNSKDNTEEKLDLYTTDRKYDII
mgnify:CR=1 FL=1